MCETVRSTDIAKSALAFTVDVIYFETSTMRAALLSLFLLTCTPVMAQSHGQVRNVGVQEVRVAQVLQITEVKLARRGGSYAGANIGSQVGYALGNSVGGGNYAISQITAQLGRSLGEGAEQGIHNRGVEILVRDVHGRVFSVIQPGHVRVSAGDTVALVGTGQNMRVVRIEPAANAAPVQPHHPCVIGSQVGAIGCSSR